MNEQATDAGLREKSVKVAVEGFTFDHDRDSVANVRARTLACLAEQELKRQGLKRPGPVPIRSSEPIPPNQLGGCVYFLQSGEIGPVKIGWSGFRGVYKRIASLQVAHYEILHLIGFVYGGRKLELAWHRRWQALRIRGEWFEPTPELMQAIRDANMMELPKLPR